MSIIDGLKQNLCSHPAFQRLQLVGTHGFGIPEFSKPTAKLMNEENAAALREKGITIRGPYGRDSYVIYDDACIYRKVNIQNFTGTENVVVAGSDKLDLDVKLMCFSSAVVTGNTPHHSRFDVRMHGRGCGLFLGPNGSSNGTMFHVQGDGSSIVVGEDHMFGWDTHVRNHDGHLIFDYESGEVLNRVCDVVIEPHVWVGFGAAIFKGVRAGAGSIIGAKSVLTRNVPRCSAFAGNPAKLRKEKISWIRHERAPSEQVESARALIGPGPAKS